MKLITYEAIFDEDLKGVFGISLVENPATKETFIQLSEQEQEALKQTEIKLATINEEQRLLVGLVLEPDSPVYRNQDGEEFNIVFKEDTITKLAHNFFKSDSHKNSSLEHNTKILGVTFVESWIVADSKKDKSNAYGLEYPSGSWLVAMKVDSDEIWNDYVKTGKVQGFSIDAIVKLKEVKNKTELSMSEKILVTLKEVSDKLAIALKLKEAPEEVKAEEVKEDAEIKMGQVMMEGGEIIFEYDGETPEPGANVFAVDKTDMENKIPAPVGKYPLEDGSILVVDVEGVIGSITPKEGEAPEEVEPVAAEQQPAAPKVDEAQKVATDIKSILIKYQEETMAKFEAIEKRFEAMNEEVVKMSEQPRRKPIKTPTAVDISKMSNFERQKYNDENGLR